VPRPFVTGRMPRQLVTSHQVEEKTPPIKPVGERATIYPLLPAGEKVPEGRMRGIARPNRPRAQPKPEAL
jgi:hypothetical protein